MTERFAEVALPLALAEPYTYRIPPTLTDRALPGARVVVPVRRRELVGVVTAVDVPPPAMVARDLLGAPDPAPAVPLPLLALAREVSRYYAAPLGLTLRAMLPGPLWGQSRVEIEVAAGGPTAVGGTAEALLDWLLEHGGRGAVSAAARAFKRPLWDVIDRLQRVGAVTVHLVPPDVRGNVATVRVVRIAGDPLPLLAREQRFARAPAQRRVYEALEQRGGESPAADLLQAADASAGVLKALERAGLIAASDEATVRDPFASLASTPPPVLSADQRRVVERLDAMAPGETMLLFGVTGSGKTLVYLERLRHALAAGRGGLILVPEIALTPQTVSRVRGVFGDQVAVLHSGLSDGERADAWRALRNGERRIAVGARSAVFAPVPSLGVIVVDEEHEATYKNGETPRYHARDVAAMRARLEGATLILGSATPSLETWTRATASARIVELPDRIDARPMPPVELIDLRHAPLVRGVAGPPWSEALDAAVTATLARREQVLLLLNRRGWASFLQCRDCGEVLQCPNCSISLTVHRQPELLRCHYCDYREPLPSACPLCGGATMQSVGAGTQQLERLVAGRFPEARIARMDLDTTSAKWSHHRIFDRVASGAVDILLGTQMIAKGIDFPNVTLVGVIDADTALHLPDFRAAERTFQLTAQVAGRTGRGPKGGKVLVQTRRPEHPALTWAIEHNVAGFLGVESAARRTPAYPPHTSLVHVVVTGPDHAAVEARAAALVDWSIRVVARHELDIVVLGPAPAPIERIRDRWRWHLILKGASRDLGRWVRAAARSVGGGHGATRVAIDRDPVSLL